MALRSLLVLSVLVLMGLLVGCPKSTPPGEARGSEIVSFSAESVSVVPGGEVRLSWVVRDAESCSVAWRAEGEEASEPVGVSCEAGSWSQPLVVPSSASYVNYQLNVLKRPFDAAEPYLTAVVRITVDRGAVAPGVVSVSIDQNDVVLPVGATAQLTATVEVVGGASDAVVWSSDDESIATVSDAGVVTGVAEGEASVVATSAFDDSRSASIAVTVVLGGGDEGVVTLVAPVAPLPGAGADDLVVVTPFGEYSVGLDVVEGEFSVVEDSVSIVGLMDTGRDFGWTALYPYWFVDVDAVGRASSSVASAHEVGPLSTAVSMVLLTPNLSTRDPALLPGMMSVLRSVPAVLELADFLDDHSAALDPLAVPGFADAYERAVDAAIDVVDGAIDTAVSSSDQVQRAGVVPIDQVFTVVNESGGLVSVEWDASVWPINRTVTHLGVIYEVDTSAYASESELRIELLNVGPNVAPALVSSDPVARISLPAEDPAAVIDVLGLAIGVVFDAVFGLFGPRDLPAANEQVLPEGAYIVHLQGCATMTSPLSLLHPDMGNYARDIEIIMGWPGSSAVGNAVNACALFAFENAVDAVSLLVNISDYLSTNWYLKHPWPDVWETVADALFDAIIATGSEGAALNSTQLNDVILLFLPALLESAAESAAQKVAEEGLRALLALKARALTSLVDLPGKLSSAASLTARSVTAEGITPLESSLVVVGDPWRDADVSVSLSPSNVTLPVNGTQSFTATVTGASDTSVTWDATCGSVPGTGNPVTYTAPATAGECVVRATSVADGDAWAEATVTVTVAPVVSVSVEPASVTLPVNGTQSFTATVTGASDTSVTWSATCGSLSGSGNTVSYTAPGSAGECEVTATSVADSSRSATAVVTVTGGGGFDPAPSYITIENVSLGAASGGTRRVGFDISWDESWRGPSRPTWVEASDNWDAAWVFVKYRVDGGAWQHATLAGSGHVVPSGAVVSVPSDRVGAFIFRSSSGYGTFTANGVGLQWDYVADGVAAGASVEVQPFGIEMVYVPQGSFSLGSGGSSTGEFRAGGTTNTPFVVSSQSSISLGDGSGQLMWTSDWFTGSPSFSTNASFPTGFGASYVMKYQVTQGQYVDFLNTLTQTQANARKHTGSDYRYAITGDSVGSYSTSLPFVAMNYISWADGAAFAHWAGLRPMTELEFEKVARGPLNPVANEYAWGSTSITGATGLADEGTIIETPQPVDANANYSGGLVGPLRVGGFASPGRSRLDAGAGYYGALELSGNLGERPVTVGNAAGRAFAGTHGDGTLDAGGNAAAVSWPGPSADGTGVRGGNWADAEFTSVRVSNRGNAAADLVHRLHHFGWRGARSAP